MQRAVIAGVLFACSSPTKTSTIVSDNQSPGFDDLAAQIASHLQQLEPDAAVSLGLHELDGVLPDRSPHALEQAVAQLTKDRDALARMPTSLDRDVLLQRLHEKLFELVELDIYRTNPMAYAGAINLADYIIRDYAPVAQRAAAVVKLCGGLAGYLAQARANVRLPIPRTWIDTALLQTKGYLEFADQDVRKELAGQPGIDAALDGCKAALAEHATWLTKQQPQGTTAYALGADRFVKMLRETQGFDLALPRLREIAMADLERNTKAITEAAHSIDAKRPVADVVRAQAEIKPPASGVLALATQQAADARAFLIAHAIVTIPSDELATVKQSPAFQRWNAAFLDRPGVFETKPLASYYYISPPDPTWPPDEQRAYIPPKADLLFTTVHEVWPGHFLHYLHIRKNPSRVLRSYCTFSTSEGWAHYSEEMLYDAGLGGKTPETHIGQLKEALLRNVRFVVAIGEHADGMTVEQATQLFAERGFVDAGNARQQAVRGTFDPMYISYTLGKLAIRKLAADWLAAHPGKALGDFHDAFLANACAPLPLIRRVLLGDDSAPL
jgi:uncharacterized protein DUF885